MERKVDALAQLRPRSSNHDAILADRYCPAVRIVSLLPSTTEIVFELGLGDSLLGVTFECNFPSSARVGREIVVGGMDTKHLSPEEIDQLVRERLAAGDELYRLDDDALRRCDPDLILSQDLCRVCAVPSGDVDAAVARLQCRAEVLQIDPQTFDEVIDSVNTVARAAGVPERGDALVAQLGERLGTLARLLEGRARPTVFVLEWIDPPFVAGHWVPDIVERAGGRPVLARPGAKSVPTDWDAVATVDPDHVVVAPCGYGLDGAVEQTLAVLDRLPERAAVWAIDADAVMVRPGPRIVDGAEAIAEALHGVGAPRPDLIRRVR